MPNDTTLKPCLWARPGEDHTLTLTASGDVVNVTCACGASGPDGEIKEVAIAAWNRRPAENPTERGEDARTVAEFALYIADEINRFHKKARLTGWTKAELTIVEFAESLRASAPSLTDEEREAIEWCLTITGRAGICARALSRVTGKGVECG